MSTNNSLIKHVWEILVEFCMAFFFLPIKAEIMDSMIGEREKRQKSKVSSSGKIC